MGVRNVRLRINIIQEPAPVLPMEDARESPRLVLEGLHVLDLDEQDVAGLGGLDLERAREVVDAGEVDVLDVVGRVVVADLAAGPVHALDLDDLVVGDLAAEGDCRGFR